MTKIAGVDEAGRGALAGPVVVSLVVLDYDSTDTSLLTDSKVLSKKQRETAYQDLRASKSTIIFRIINHKTVDKLNVLQATLSGMEQCIRSLDITPSEVIVDGNRHPKIEGIPISSCVKGDSKVPEISAASIVAKVIRDKIMQKYHKVLPHYQFNKHKGYGTEAHYTAIFEHGRSKIHRNSFNCTKQLTLF